ncbi:hypothetical protein EXS71_03825 [Candidatus Uhrbacteria bacterium]|nr:hypothetical protein [Candidatus Uhrbacteria bacterium]
MSTDIRRQKIVRILHELALDAREIEVFFSLLDLGKAKATILAKQVKHIPRTSIYDILQSLQTHGLISQFIEKDETYYQVENIEHVVDMIEAQKQKLTEKQDLIRSASDLFHQVKAGTAYQPAIRFFEGKNGILAIHRELQNARKETRTIVNIASVHKVFSSMLHEDNLKDFQTYKILKKDLMIKTLEAERYLKVSPVGEFHQTKWLPEEVAFQTDTLIWEGHVAIIDYTGHLSGIVIDNPAIAETFVAWFEMMWRTA